MYFSEELNHHVLFYGCKIAEACYIGSLNGHALGCCGGCSVYRVDGRLLILNVDGNIYLAVLSIYGLTYG